MKLNYNGATDFSFTVYDVAEENAQLNRGAYEMFYYGDSELNFSQFHKGREQYGGVLSKRDGLLFGFRRRGRKTLRYCKR